MMRKKPAPIRCCCSWFAWSGFSFSARLNRRFILVFVSFIFLISLQKSIKSHVAQIVLHGSLLLKSWMVKIEWETERVMHNVCKQMYRFYHRAWRRSPRRNGHYNADIELRDSRMRTLRNSHTWQLRTILRGRRTHATFDSRRGRLYRSIVN